ncbi:MAG: NIPSNAP family protein [Armatimonadota bacterium]
MSNEQRYIEFRIYRLNPGVQIEFHNLVERHSIPMLAAVGMDVVAYGPVPGIEDGYVLIRAYDSPEQLQMSQDEFYSSDAWRLGPRDAILGLIESHESHEAWYSPSMLESIVSIMEKAQIANPLGPELPNLGIKRGSDFRLLKST